jgi:hypothetical protein
MHKLIPVLMMVGVAVSSIASAEPGTRKRLSPEQSEAKDVRPSSPNIENRGDPSKGPNGYKEPTDSAGKKRLGNDDTPGVTEKGNTSSQ